jgi:outer membrane protein insertion porin family
VEQPSNAATESLRAWTGLQVETVEFQGVDRSRLEPLPNLLPLQPNQPLRAEDVRQSLRRLFETGLYKGISVEGARDGDRVTIIFNGAPTVFLGRISVEGVKSDRLTSQLQRSTRLTAGTTFSDTKLSQATSQMLRRM